MSIFDYIRRVYYRILNIKEYRTFEPVQIDYERVRSLIDYIIAQTEKEKT